MSLRNLAAAALTTLVAAGTAAAMPVSADFRAEFDLFDSGPKTLERLAEPVAGAPDLDLSDQISNPNGWLGFASVDLDSAFVITLTGDQSESGFANYETGVFTIWNIVFDAGETITGVTALTSGLLDPNYDLGAIAPSISFTGNSVTITYDTGGLGEFEFLDGGISTFLIETDGVSEVPLPAGGALLIAALGGFAVLRRRPGRA